MFPDVGQVFPTPPPKGPSPKSRLVKLAKAWYNGSIEAEEALNELYRIARELQ